jgi:hypothetical protein
LKFASSSTNSWVQLDGFSSDILRGIIRGRLKVSGEDMAALFAPSIKAIKEGLEAIFVNNEHLADVCTPIALDARILVHLVHINCRKLFWWAASQAPLMSSASLLSGAKH